MALTLNSQLTKYKVIVIGDAAVGKTSLTYRFCEGKFLAAPETTIGIDFRQRRVEIDDDAIMLQLWDTAGMEKHRDSMAQHYYRNVHAVIFVYDVGSQKSFDSIKHWIDECEQYAVGEPLKIIVANKCDGEMCVNRNKAQKFADDHNMPLFETSAKLDSQCNNVDAIFLTLAHKLKSQRPLITPSKTVIRSITSGNEQAPSSGCCW